MGGGRRGCAPRMAFTVSFQTQPSSLKGAARPSGTEARGSARPPPAPGALPSQKAAGGGGGPPSASRPTLWPLPLASSGQEAGWCSPLQTKWGRKTRLFCCLRPERPAPGPALECRRSGSREIRPKSAAGVLRLLLKRRVTLSLGAGGRTDARVRRDSAGTGYSRVADVGLLAASTSRVRDGSTGF